MSLLVSALWPGLTAAFLLGLGVGALAGLPRRGAGLWPALGLGAGLAGLAGLALSGILPGEAGAWVEGAMLLLAAYLAGCAGGGFGRRLGSRA